MRLSRLFASSITLAALTLPAQQQVPDDIIPTTRPVPTGKAPNMQVKRLNDDQSNEAYAIIFLKGDDALSGLTDFAIAHNIKDAQFTAIGAVSSATLAWLNPTEKAYHRIQVDQQCEVLALTGDISLSTNGKPFVHMHAILGKRDGSTVGGHVFELNVNPTLEVMMTVRPVALKRRPDDASGMKVIDPKQ